MEFHFSSFIERHLWCTVFDAVAAKVDLVGHNISAGKTVSPYLVHI